MEKTRYTPEYDGDLGIVRCAMCDVSMDVDEEAIQSEYDADFYCQDCYAQHEEEREEELLDAFGDDDE